MIKNDHDEIPGPRCKVVNMAGHLLFINERQTERLLLPYDGVGWDMAPTINADELTEALRRFPKGQPVRIALEKDHLVVFNVEYNRCVFVKVNGCSSRSGFKPLR